MNALQMLKEVVIIKPVFFRVQLASLEPVTENVWHDVVAKCHINFCSFPSQHT